MSFAQLFGLDKVGQQSVQEAHATVNDALVKADPLLRDFTNRIGGICHGLMDRIKLSVSISISIGIAPVPKAEPVEPVDGGVRVPNAS
jgi:hypothetical protein